MEALDFRRDRERFAACLISIAAHALLLGLLLVLSRTEPNLPPAEETFSVEILTAEQFASLAAPVKRFEERLPQAPSEVQPSPEAGSEANAAPRAPDAAAAPPVAAPAAPPVEGVWHQATRLLSEAALVDPRNKKATDKLPKLEVSAHLEQLCNLEAILQIRQSGTEFRPEFVVAYAMGDTRNVAGMLIADGAAFRSGGKWYNLAFKCRISARRQKVEAFAFAVGAAIPKRDWAAHDLPHQLTEMGDE